MTFTLRSHMIGTENPALYPRLVLSAETVEAARESLGRMAATLATVADTLTIEAQDGTIVERWSLQNGAWKPADA